MQNCIFFSFNNESSLIDLSSLANSKSTFCGKEYSYSFVQKTKSQMDIHTQAGSDWQILDLVVRYRAST